MFVKPADGLLIRDPHSRQPLSPEGREVPEEAFWHQLLRQGDVTLVEDAPEPEAAPPAEPAPGQAEPVANAPTNDEGHLA